MSTRPGFSSLPRQSQENALKQTPTGSKPGPRKRSAIPQRLLSMREAAQYLSVSYWTVRSWVEGGKLRAVRLPGGGKLIRIELTELDRLVETCRDA